MIQLSQRLATLLSAAACVVHVSFAMYTFNAQILKKKEGPGIDRPLINPVDDGFDHDPRMLLFEHEDDDKDFAWRTMRDFFDLQLFVEVDVGRPGQTMRVVADTGSKWVWVQTGLCSRCGGSNHYDTELSETLVELTDYH